jgi:hypothetical protein
MTNSGRRAAQQTHAAASVGSSPGVRQVVDPGRSNDSASRQFASPTRHGPQQARASGHSRRTTGSLERASELPRKHHHETLHFMESLESIWPVSDVPSRSISIHDGAGKFLRDFAAADVVRGTIFAAYWWQAEVLNGGLSQFFGNSAGVLAPEAVEACRRLGLALLASRLQHAMEWFGSPYPRDRALRQDRLEAFALRQEADPFEAMDDEIVKLIYEESGGLEAAASAYVRQRAAGDF